MTTEELRQRILDLNKLLATGGVEALVSGDDWDIAQPMAIDEYRVRKPVEVWIIKTTVQEDEGGDFYGKAYLTPIESAQRFWTKFREVIE